jgi:hypothetical protein
MTLAETFLLCVRQEKQESSLAMAQSCNTAGNAVTSGGSGAHQGSQKTGSASNTQKVQKQQNGYQGGHQ